MENQFILTPFYLDQALPQLESLVQPSWQVNRPYLPSGAPQTRMAVLYQSLANFVEDAINRNLRPVSLAGDCCTSLGVAAGLQKAGISPTLVWLDAHGDFNTWETTPSGFLGGMPLAMLVGLGEQSIVESLRLNPFPEEKVILSDARNLDPGERQALERSKILRLPNTKSLLEDSLPEGPLYIHFDPDVIDPKDAPAMDFPASGGIGVVNLQSVFHRLAQTRRVVAVSMATWNPALDPDGLSQKMCMRLLQELII
jgi:arginase